MNCRLRLTVLALLALGGPVSFTSGQEAAYARDAQPFLKKYCIACHGPDQPKGGVRLDGSAPDLGDATSAAKWLAVKRMVSQGQMPPEGSKQPKADDVIAVLAWIDDASARAAVVTRGGPGRRALRRLTNREYVNTLHDLLGLSFPHAIEDLTRRLPKDDAPDSFSNDSNLQVMQRLQLQRRLDLAEDLLSVAFPDDGEVKPMRFSADLRKLAAGKLPKFEGLSEVEQKKLGGVTVRGTLPSEIEGTGPAKIEIRGDRGNLNMVLRADHFDPARGLLLEPNPILAGVSRNNIAVLLPFVPDRGVLRLKAKAAALMECDDSRPVLRLSFGGTLGPGDTAYPAAQVTVEAGDKPLDYVLEVPLALAPGDWNSFRREKHLWVQIDNAAALLGPTKVPEKFDARQRDKHLRRNRLLIESFTLEVEASAVWPAESESVLLPGEEGEGDHDRAKRSLSTFLNIAFRRPATEKEITAYHGLYLKQRMSGTAFLAAYRTAVAAALISPQVQYLVESKSEKRTPLTGWELAARLSYLMWNTTPDAELLARAADGSLSTEKELRKQFERLLAHERAFTMPREFTRQWLDLDVVPYLEPAVSGSQRWPDSEQDRRWYDKVIRDDLAAEPAHYMLDLLRNDRPVTQLIGSEHMVVNDRLARYYGVTDFKGHGWQLVAAQADHCGGLLTQAGCIAAATHGQQRGEIKRGVYLARRFLGLDILSPPGNVDIKPLDIQLKEDRDLARLTSRQLLERHRTVTSCAVCHQRTDPLGLVWDGFDLYGQPRRDRQGKSLPVDSSGSLPDRTRFADFGEFRKLLADDAPEKDRFTGAFSRRLFAYVLGRGLDPGDDVHLKAIRAAASKEKGGLRALLTAMVLSEPFRNK